MVEPADWRADAHRRGLTVYLVGGAVRDALLGLPPGERDFVVVGATPESMVDQGFRPVGRDFPVFIHPDTGEEYALARTERKQGRGYHGFVFHAGVDVSLEADLERRDLTVNAIAEDADGKLFDPYGGRTDIEARRLRHVSEAFREDPVRLLRLARFAARFRDFDIAGDTLDLARAMVDEGEVDHLVPERVWQEMARALMHDAPARFFEVLRATGALARILPEVEALFGVPQVERYHPEIDAGVHTLMVVDQAAAEDAGLPVRFACLVHDLGKALTPAGQLPSHHGHEESGLAPVAAVCDRLKVPRACRDLALLVCRWHLHIHRAETLKASTLVRVLEGVDAFRRPERLDAVLAACRADKRGRKGMADKPYPQAGLVRRVAAAAAAVDAAALAASGLNGPAMAQALRQERVRAVSRVLRQPGGE